MDSPVRGFSHVQLRVADIDASVAWYSTALGLVRHSDAPLGGAVPMFGAGGRFAIVISDGRRDDAGGEVDHLAFAVSDRETLAAWGEQLIAAGILHGGLVTSGEGLSIHLVDPDGLNVELIAP
ncbi:MAG: Glyoxalase/bleomycin resistance protein/dioxygenase [Actinomycetia bacterium]|nr:Glyoxalase/bleomycin resistance protein/dioxygenase [Actinomycetes bacterium]